MSTLPASAPRDPATRKQYLVTLEDEFSAKAYIRLDAGEVQFAKSKSPAEPWFSAPYTSIVAISLTKPQLTLRAPNGKKLTVAFSSGSDAEEALVELQHITQPKRGSPDQPDASMGAQVANTPTLAAEAQEVLRNIASSPEALSAAKRSMCARQMVGGAIAFLVGLLVTTMTYERATQQGGLYVVTWGALLFGPIFFLRGLVGWVSESSAQAAEKARGERAQNTITKGVPGGEASAPDHDDGRTGTCPNCNRLIPLRSEICKHCQAAFGPGSAWKVVPHSHSDA